MCELRGLISLKLAAMLNTMTEAQVVAKSSDPTDLWKAESQEFLFSGHISVLNSMKKSWDNELVLLKMYLVMCSNLC